MSADQQVVIFVKTDGVSASDLKAALGRLTTDEQQKEQLTIDVPRPQPGTFGMIDPGTVQIILHVLSGTGAVAIGIRSAAKVLEKYFDTKRDQTRVKIGKDTLIVPKNISSQDQKKMVDEFIAAVTRGNDHAAP